MAADRELVLNNAFFPGLAHWARTVDDWYRDGGSFNGKASDALHEAYVHVQRDSSLGVWMYEISRLVDGASPCWDLSNLCTQTENMIAASSALGVWMREMSKKPCVG